MKLSGIAGYGTGKMGNMVFSVRNGEQIVRQYNPVVSNPQTDAQVASRSRLKLMSQLAAILAPVLAIPSDGLKSKRNQFISQNYDLSFYANDEASINLDQVQLTKSSVALPSFNVTRADGEHITVSLAQDSHLNFDRIVYVCIVKQADGSMSLFDGRVVTEPGDGGVFSAELQYTAAPICVYAYGISANDDSTLTRFDNIVANSSMNLASVANRSRDLLANITYSITRGVVLDNGVTTGSAISDRAVVTISKNPSNGGSVQGAGTFALGAEVTVQATPFSDYSFAGWRLNGNIVSTATSYTFNLSGNTNLVAEFQRGGGISTD